MADQTEARVTDTLQDIPVIEAAPAPQAAPAAEALAQVAFPAKAKRAAARKPAAAKPAKLPRKAPTKPIGAKPAITRKIATQTEPATKPAQVTIVSKLKDTITMATKKTPDLTEGFKTVVAEAQTKAQEAFEKGSAAFGEAGEFAKGNVEAMVESTKILGSGLKDMGEEIAKEAKTVYETLTADAKELAAVKSPVDFFKLQGEIMRRNFDAAMAQGSKNTEAMMKLANDSFAPLSGRISLVVEKVKKAA